MDDMNQAPSAAGAEKNETTPREPREDRGQQPPSGDADRSSSSAAREPGGEGSTGSGSARNPGAGGGAEGAAKRRRRGKRGGRRHNKNRTGGGTGGDGSPDAKAEGAGSNPSKVSTGEGSEASQDAPRPRQARQPRPPRPKPETNEETTSASTEGGSSKGSAPSGSSDQPAAEGSSTGPRRRRRRGGAKRSGGSGGGAGGAGAKAAGDASDATQAAKSDDPEGPNGNGEKRSLTSAELAAGGATRLAARKLREEQRKSRGRGRRPRRLTEADAQRLKGKPKTMLIHDHEERTQIAIMEDHELIEHYVSRRGQRGTMVGNIYLGRVQNVLAGMEAAFVDFGRGRNGIIYANEISFSEEDLDGDIPRIEKALKSGQRMLVQVTKDPIGTKGARLTTQVTIAGRYLVLAPDQDASGVSRRLADRERQRLRKILSDLNPPPEHGIIVRTAADGAAAEAIAADLGSLLKRWEEISKTMKGAKAPAPLYEEPELIMRVVRDIFADDFKVVVCDSRRVFDEIRGYLQEAAPDLVDKVSLHEGPLPLLEEYHVAEQLHKSLERKVWLPSGGSLIFERTEAMTVVDVNTGKFTGKGNLEDTVFKNNCEAAEEIARQLRLRDIGGIIIIDFIDMIDPKNQKELLKTLKQALATDKTKSQVFEVSNLGLVEMTRKRVSEGLVEAFSETCPNCDGRGIVVQHRID